MCRLSAFVAKSFHQAKPYIFVDMNLVDKTLGWIIDRQNSNGRFSEPSGGRVIHTDMQVSETDSDNILACSWVASITILTSWL